MLSIRALFASVALALAGAPALATNLVANGGFETGDFTGWTTQPAAAGSLFTVGGGAHTGFFSAEFGATAGQHDQIWQNIPTVPESAYTISFWVYNSGNGSDSLIVQWNGDTIFNETPVSTPDTWRLVNLLVVAAGEVSELRFAAHDNPSYVFLDDIAIESGNLIVNPGFETGDFTGWNTQPAAAGSIFGVLTISHAGSYGAGFAAVNSLHDQIWQNVPTTPGRAYILQFWLNNFSQGDDSLQVSWEGTQIYNGTPPPTTANGWVMLSFIVVSTGPSSELRFGGYDGTAAVWIDDVYLAAPTNGACLIEGDADRSGEVNFADITAVLRNWGFFCAP